MIFTFIIKIVLNVLKNTPDQLHLFLCDVKQVIHI